MMSNLAELFRQGRHEELWHRCCGFIDLSLQEFMRIQRQLLLEQLEVLKKCDLGQHVMSGLTPRNVEEFRELVPLTTYDDYAPFLLKRRMSGLPRRPMLWQYTSGKSGEYAYRWVPVTARQLDEIEPLIFALLLFSSCKRRGEVAFKALDKVLYGMAPPPYATGTMARVFPYELFRFLPPLARAEEMTFEDRIKEGFDEALSEGLDLCLTLSSVAVAIGNRFSDRGSKTSIKPLLKHPKALGRLARGIAKSRLGNRPLMPRDLWSPKGLITYGIDGEVYRQKIKEMWGRYPLQFHGCTEAVMIAMQTWDYQDMTFVPHLNFFEFIPEQEALRARQDPAYKPSTCLLDEVVPGKYELVITSFHGGPFVRYRLGHLIEITGLRNERLDIDIPQMVFLARVDDQIDIAGFTRLSEKVIWQAIENSGLPYVDWIARKEVQDRPALNLYIELKGNGHQTSQEISSLIHEELKKLDTPYSELESMTGLKPMKVTLLAKDAFNAFRLKQQAVGAELEQLRPPHINPSEEVLDFLMDSAAQRAATERTRVEA
jgi:GH3 auxin-responsive promoter